MGLMGGGYGSRGFFGDDGTPRAFDETWMRDALANNAMTPRSEKQGSPFLKTVGKIGLALLENLPAAGMSPYDAARYGSMLAEGKRKRKEFETKMGLLQQAHAAIDADPNMSPQEKALAKVNVEEYQKRWAEQYGTHNVNEGDSLVRGVGGGKRDVFVAPKTFQEGADVAQTAPQSFQLPASAPMIGGGDDGSYRGAGGAFGSAPHVMGPGRVPVFGGTQGFSTQNFPASGLMGSSLGRTMQGGTMLRTQAEQYADSLGFNRGTPDWGNAVRDYTLKEYGPTANSEKRTLKSWELGQSNTNNLRTTAASRYSADTSRDNRNNTPAATVLNERGEVVLAYPNNRTTTLRHSQPVPTARPSRGNVAPRTGGAGRGVEEGTVIRNPRTGQRMVMRGGKWTKF